MAEHITEKYYNTLDDQYAIVDEFRGFKLAIDNLESIFVGDGQNVMKKIIWGILYNSMLIETDEKKYINPKVGNKSKRVYVRRPKKTLA
jgi:hypothetical protein